MIVCRHLFAVLAFAALLLGAGCGGGERSVVGPETDEAAYKEGQQFKLQGRYNEALLAFKRVIEKRGEQASAESHLEVGLLYLERMKDPNEAIHHFKKYLELQPNAPQASLVRGRIDVAKLLFGRTVRGPNPLESVQVEQQELVERLQRENEELRRDNQSLRNGGTASAFRTIRAAPEADPAGMKVAPPPPLIVTGFAPPLSGAPATPSGRPASTMALPIPVLGQSAVPPRASPIGSPAAPPIAASRRHTVAAGETLFRISVKYFGNGSKVDEIFNANRDVMPNKNTLPRIGTELKIP